MKRLLQSGVVIFAGVLGIATASVQPGQDITKSRKRVDLRETILRKFFRDSHSPAEEFTGLFLSEADNHSLDWRLLPSISFVESGGGKTAKNNNLFGWNNGRFAFGTVGQAIHDVAFTLSHGRQYKGKDVRGKLEAYNPDTQYRDLVLSVMHKIAPNPLVGVAAE